MFTGIIEQTLRVTGVSDVTGFRRLTLENPWPDVREGQSIAVNGCCLTVSTIHGGEIGFDVIPETLAKTNLGALAPGNYINAERSLRLGDRLDGHFVQGHVDGTAILVDVKTTGDEHRLILRPPDELLDFIAPKGSVTLDGVSLTVAGKSSDVFEVALIPTTINLTTIGRMEIGWPFNLETDILAKTVVNWLRRQRAGKDA
ncbi:MAG: riboflavin synthase [Tepidisphaeraceae bacterium]|jgi:riboflavin synthase